MRLKNPSCQIRGKCQSYCNMCLIEKDEERVISRKSLFGACRTSGVCLKDCGLCKAVAIDYLKRDGIRI